MMAFMWLNSKGTKDQTEKSLSSMQPSHSVRPWRAMVLDYLSDIFQHRTARSKIYLKFLILYQCL